MSKTRTLHVYPFLGVALSRREMCSNAGKTGVCAVRGLGMGCVLREVGGRCMICAWTDVWSSCGGGVRVCAMREEAWRSKGSKVAPVPNPFHIWILTLRYKRKTPGYVGTETPE